MSPRRAVRAAAAAMTVLAPAAAQAQIPGLPTLQSPFASPQVAVGANGARGDSVSVVGVAAAWTPQSARLQFTGGAAAVTRQSRTGVGAGARAYLPLRTFAGQTVAAGVFLGAGGDRVSGATTLATTLGASVGYRRAVGETRAVAVYAVPFYSYNRRTGAGANSSLLRVSLGADVVLVPRVGLSAGVETGQRPGDGGPGPARTVTGAGLTYAF